MNLSNANVVAFPGHHCRPVKACPHCGSQTDFWRFGRLLWAYCETHEVRWVAADFGNLSGDGPDRVQLRKTLEFLSSFVEISR